MVEDPVKEELKGKGGGKKKLFIFILLGILIIGIAGGGLFLVFSKKGGETEEVKSTKGKKGKKKGEVAYFDLDPIIVNLLDPTGKRYLQVRMTLEIEDKKAEEEVRKIEPIIKDIILSTLSGKTLEEVIVPEAKDKIKRELLQKLNEGLDKELISNIYITQYIVE
ncbi:MAG: flagellar basal body-associated protein FliL [Caldimicrobium sp.]